MAKRQRTPLEEQAGDIMQDLAIRFFNNQCFCSHEKFKKRGFVIHHLKYIDNDVRRENYPKGEKGRLEYLIALRPMVEAMPWRFMLLKNGYHTRLDSFKTGLTRMKPDNVTRLFLAYLLTEKKRKVKKTKSFKRYKKK